MVLSFLSWPASLARLEWMGCAPRCRRADPVLVHFIVWLMLISALALSTSPLAIGADEAPAAPSSTAPPSTPSTAPAAPSPPSPASSDKAPETAGEAAATEPRLPPERGNAPGDAAPRVVLTEAAYTVVLDPAQRVARIRAELTVHCLFDTWSPLPLPFFNAAVERFASEPPGVLLGGLEEGGYAALIRGQGPHQIVLDLLQEYSDTEATFDFDCPPAGQTRLTITLPGKPESIEIEPTAPGRQVTDDEQSTRVEARLPPTSHLHVHWSHEKPAAAATEADKPYWQSHGRTRCHVTPAGARFVSDFVFQGEAHENRELRLQWPAGWSIVRVVADGLTGDRLDTSNVLTLTFKEPLPSSGLELHLEGRKSLSWDDASPVDFPMVVPLDNSHWDAEVALLASPDVLVNLPSGAPPWTMRCEPGGQDAWDDVPDDWTKIGSWRLAPPASPVPFTAVIRNLQATVRVETRVLPEAARVRVESTLKHQLTRAGVRELMVAVPAEATNDLFIAIEGGRIVNQRVGPTDAGWTPVTLVLADRSDAEVTCELKYSLPGRADGLVHRFDVEPPRPLGWMRGKGDQRTDVPEVQLTHTDGVLTVMDSPGMLSTIEAEGLVRDPDSQSFRYGGAPEPAALPRLHLGVEQPTPPAGPNAVILHSRVRAHLNHGNDVRFACQYRVLTHNRQTLGLMLPKSAEIVRLTLDGQPARLWRTSLASSEGRESFRLGLAGSHGDPESPLDIELDFVSPYRSALLKGWGGRVELVLPELGSAADHMLELQDPHLAVSVPADYLLWGQPPGFEPAPPFSKSEPDEDAADGHILEGSDRPDPMTVYRATGHADVARLLYWRRSYMAWIVSGTLFLVGAVLAATSWRNRLACLLCAGLCLVLFALWSPGTVEPLVSVGSYGLVATLVLWTILALPRRRAARDRSPSPATPAPAMAPAVSTSPPP